MPDKVCPLNASVLSLSEAEDKHPPSDPAVLLHVTTSAAHLVCPVLLFPPFPSPTVKHPFEPDNAEVSVSISLFVPSKTTRVSLVSLNRRWQQ